MELREPLYRDQYEEEHLKPSVAKLLLSPETYCRTQALLAQGHKGPAPAPQGPPADNSALLQFLTKKGFCPKVQEADVTEGDLSKNPINTVRLSVLCFQRREIKKGVEYIFIYNYIYVSIYCYNMNCVKVSV